MALALDLPTPNPCSSLSLTLACRSSELPVPRYSCSRRGSTLACATALACSGLWRPICPNAQAAAACVCVLPYMWASEHVYVNEEGRGSAIIIDNTAVVVYSKWQFSFPCTSLLLTWMWSSVSSESVMPNWTTPCKGHTTNQSQLQLATPMNDAKETNCPLDPPCFKELWCIAYSSKPSFTVATNS